MNGREAYNFYFTCSRESPPDDKDPESGEAYVFVYWLEKRLVIMKKQLKCYRRRKEDKGLL